MAVHRRSGPEGARERAPAAPPSAASTERPPVQRRPHLDNVRTLLIAVIIAVHALIGYADFPGAWPYSDVAEAYLAWPTVVVVFGAASPFLILMIALLFLVAGLLTPSSFDRKGPARFAGGRLLRLGLPFAVFLLLWPTLEYAVFRPFGHVQGSYGGYLRDSFPDPGPLWFVGLLLLASLLYSAGRGLRGAGAPSSRPLTSRTLLLLAGLVAVGSFAVRLAWPYGSTTPLGLNEYQWPECFALFAVGVLGARQGWTTAVPAPLARHARIATLLAGAGLALFLVASLPFGLGPDDILGGRHWAALAVDCAEGVLTVCGCVWALAVAQRRLDRPSRRAASMARSAYAAFVVQGFVLLALAVLLRPIPVYAGAKALVVAVLGVVGSFRIGRLLITRVPILGRVL